MLGSPRTLFAFARDGVLPAVVARIHPRFHTPVHRHRRSTRASSRRVSISSSFTQLAVLANVAALTLYLMCVAASYELQRRDVRADGGIPFAVPGGPADPDPGGGGDLWLLSSATRREFGVEALVLAVAALFYFIRRTGGQL